MLVVILDRPISILGRMFHPDFYSYRPILWLARAIRVERHTRQICLQDLIFLTRERLRLLVENSFSGKDDDYSTDVRLSRIRILDYRIFELRLEMSIRGWLPLPQPKVSSLRSSLLFGFSWYLSSHQIRCCFTGFDFDDVDEKLRDLEDRTSLYGQLRGAERVGNEIKAAGVNKNVVTGTFATALDNDANYALSSDRDVREVRSLAVCELPMAAARKYERDELCLEVGKAALECYRERTKHATVSPGTTFQDTCKLVRRDWQHLNSEMRPIQDSPTSMGLRVSNYMAASPIRCVYERFEKVSASRSSCGANHAIIESVLAQTVTHSSRDYCSSFDYGALEWIVHTIRARDTQFCMRQSGVKANIKTCSYQVKGGDSPRSDSRDSRRIGAAMIRADVDGSHDLRTTMWQRFVISFQDCHELVSWQCRPAFSPRFVLADQLLARSCWFVRHPSGRYATTIARTQGSFSQLVLRRVRGHPNVSECQEIRSPQNSPVREGSTVHSASLAL